jgi:TetR/AcrR family transcriptional regulator
MLSMNHGKTPPQKRKPTVIRKMEIVDAAMRIIVNEGTRRFTVNHLAAEIGVTSGAVFRHFPNMEAIVEAVIEYIDAVLFNEFPPTAEDPLERLGIFFNQRVRVIVKNPYVSRMLLSDHLAHAAGREQSGRIEEFKRRSGEFVLECLREARRKGQLQGLAGPREGVVIVMGAIFALAHATTRVEHPGRIEKLSQNVWSVIETTLLGVRHDAKSEAPKRRSRGHLNKKMK